jgi:hypothetical protein
MPVVNHCYWINPMIEQARPVRGYDSPGVRTAQVRDSPSAVTTGCHVVVMVAGQARPIQTMFDTPAFAFHIGRSSHFFALLLHFRKIAPHNC